MLIEADRIKCVNVVVGGAMQRPSDQGCIFMVSGESLWVALDITLFGGLLRISRLGFVINQVVVEAGRPLILDNSAPGTEQAGMLERAIPDRAHVFVGVHI